MSAFDFESMTLREVETIENLTGLAIDKLVEDGTPKGKNLTALIFVLGKRNDPAFTIDQAADYTLKDAMAMFGGDQDPKDAS